MSHDEHGRVREVHASEIAAWCACPLEPSDDGADAWANGERMWVARHHRGPGNLFAFDDGVRFVGKYDVARDDGASWRLWAPSIREAGAGAGVMLALCEHIRDESQRRSIRDIKVILEGGHRHIDCARNALVASGFVLAQERVLVRRALDDTLPPTPRPDLGIRGCAPLTPEALDDLCRVVGVDAENPDIDAGIAALNPGSLVLEDGESTVGLALCASAPGEETLHLEHLGVVPDSRGCGVGAALLLAVLGRARELGSRVYIGSTAKDNAPMRGVFASVGCTHLAERFVYTLTIRGAGAGSP